MENEKIERLRDRMLQCPICIDEYKDPRILPCHHSVCLVCLQDYVQCASSSGRLFRCPQCRADVCVPRGGVQEFPPNFYINCIQDEIGSKPYFSTCEVCTKDWLVSQYRCVDCDIDICKFCVQEHRLFTHLTGRQANIMRIETGDLGASLTSELDCTEHNKEPLLMYCNNCLEAVCVKCVCNKHKNHDTTTLTEKLHHAQKLLQFELDKIQLDTKQVKSVLEKVREVEKNGEKSAEEVIGQIQEQAEQIIDVVHRMADCKIEQVQARKGGHVQTIRAYETELADYLDHLQRGGSFLNDLQEEDMSLQLVECFTKYKTLLDLKRGSVVNKEIKQDHFSFQPGRLMQVSGKMAMNFGTVQTMEAKDVFMVEEQKVSRWRREVKRVLSARNWYLAFVVISTGIGIASLLMTLLENEICPEHVICFIFLIYLCLAAVFAYRKAHTHYAKEC